MILREPESITDRWTKREINQAVDVEKTFENIVKGFASWRSFVMNYCPAVSMECWHEVIKQSSVWFFS